MTNVWIVWFLVKQVVDVFDHWPVMIRHSLWSKASVKRRETISSGLIRKRISSWTRPALVTPPPTYWLAKSTCKSKQMHDSEGNTMEHPDPCRIYFIVYSHAHVFYSKYKKSNTSWKGLGPFTFICDRIPDKLIGKEASGAGITQTSVPPMPEWALQRSST